MDLVEAEVCARLPLVAGELHELGLEVRYELVGVLGTGGCASSSTREVDPETRVAQETDWLEAVVSVAREFDWASDFTRLIVPVVKQPPPGGGGADDDSTPAVVAAAAAVARAEGVSVAPWILPPTLAGPPLPDLRAIAQAIAAATSGSVAEWDASDAEVALALHGVKARVGCTPRVDGVTPSSVFHGDRLLVVSGSHLRPGTRVSVDRLPVRDLEVGAGGEWATFRLPAGLEPGRAYALQASRPGSGEATLPDAVVLEEPLETLVIRALRGIRFRRERDAREVTILVDWSRGIRASPGVQVDWSTQIRIEVDGEEAATLPEPGFYVDFNPELPECHRQCGGSCKSDEFCEDITLPFGPATCICSRELTSPDATPRPLDPGDRVRVTLLAAPGAEEDAVPDDDTLEVVFEEGGTHFFRGDCNEDGVIDVSDPVCLLSWLFLGTEEPGCIAALNANGDRAVDISDALAFLNHLFLGGPAPVEPYPDCGPGTLPADESLGCKRPPERCR